MACPVAYMIWWWWCNLVPVISNHCTLIKDPLNRRKILMESNRVRNEHRRTVKPSPELNHRDGKTCKLCAKPRCWALILGWTNRNQWSKSIQFLHNHQKCLMRSWYLWGIFPWLLLEEKLQRTCRRQCGAGRTGKNNETWKYFLSSKLDKVDETITSLQLEVHRLGRPMQGTRFLFLPHLPSTQMQQIRNSTQDTVKILDMLGMQHSATFANGHLFHLQRGLLYWRVDYYSKDPLPWGEVLALEKSWILYNRLCKLQNLWYKDSQRTQRERKVNIQKKNEKGKRLYRRSNIAEHKKYEIQRKWRLLSILSIIQTL